MLKRLRKIGVFNDTDIFTDAWTSGNPGIGGFRIMDVGGNVLFSKDYDTPHTNNWYEFAGIVASIIKFPNRCLYTDSITGIAWSEGRMSKKVKASYAADPAMQIMLSIVKKNPPLCILKWDTEKWGEIIADYGRKN